MDAKITADMAVAVAVVVNIIIRPQLRLRRARTRRWPGGVTKGLVKDGGWGMRQYRKRRVDGGMWNDVGFRISCGEW